MANNEDVPQAKPANRSGATCRWRSSPPVCALAYAAGLQDYLSLQVLAEQRDTLKAVVADHRIASAHRLFVLYALAVAFAFPGGVHPDDLRGLRVRMVYCRHPDSFAATTGAAAIFLAARSAFGDVLRKRAGPFAAKLADGFAKDAFGYLLVLRLAPVFPFLS
jgi:uncharacterized membrane protein YdjX (TVP38/TMEM64 family)